MCKQKSLGPNRVCPLCEKNIIKNYSATQCKECYNNKRGRGKENPLWTGCKECPRCGGVKCRKSKLCLRCTYDTKYFGLPKCKECGDDLSRYEYSGFCNKCYRGENHVAWNNELSKDERENHKTRLYDPRYTQWRKKVWIKNEYTCKCCGHRKRRDLTAHHIENYSSNKDKRYDVDNGITFCKNCHDIFHKIYGKRNNNLGQIILFISVGGRNSITQGKLF